MIWLLHIGRAGHPGPGACCYPPGQLFIEFANIGGWLTCGDLALDSCGQFLAVVEHRLIPSRVRSTGHLLRKASWSSVGLVPCLSRSGCWWSRWSWSGRPGGAPVALPSFATSEFQECFGLGRALRVTLPSGKGGVVHLFVVFGYQGEEEHSEKLLLTDKLLQPVLAEAWVVYNSSFSVFASFSFDRWSAEVSCPIVSQPLCGLLPGLTLLLGAPLRYLVLFRMPGM